MMVITTETIYEAGFSRWLIRCRSTNTSAST